MVKKVLLQLSILLLISTLCGFWFKSFNISFIVGFLTGTVLQFGLFYTITTFLNLYIALKNKKLDNERLKEFSYQSLEVECPCFKKIKEIVPIRLNTPNYYKCSECNKSVSVIIGTETAVVTEPLPSTDLPFIDTEFLRKLQNGNT